MGCQGLAAVNNTGPVASSPAAPDLWMVALIHLQRDGGNHALL